jgi:uncharacterized protein YdeI (YjbR/CyaY-like superfamily)
MKTLKTFRALNLKQWRTWLARNRDSEREVWLIFPKTHTGQKSISYDDALDEALCHGWIDSLIRRLDDDFYARKFTPRTNTQNWSQVNKERVERLTKAGRMTQAGLAKVDFSAVQPRRETRKPLPVPDFVKRGLQCDQAAWHNFNSLPPSHQRAYVGWIATAKREETRQRRLAEADRMLKQNQRLGLK